MLSTKDHFLTTHAGSLPRTKDLVELHVALSNGEEVDQNKLEDTIHASTESVIQNQIKSGINIGNNGEQARESFFTYVQHRMSGFGGASNRPPFQDMVDYPSWMELKLSGYLDGVSLVSAPQAQGKISYANKAPLEKDTFYGDMDAYIEALAMALKTEYNAIHTAGHILQLDCPDLAMERHVYFAESSDTEFIDFINKVIKAIDTALTDIPRESVRMHVCWGNYNGPHDSDIPLKTILPSLIKANVGALMLSMANPRHAHEYKLLTKESLPDNMLIIAGVIDTTSNYVEHPEVVADRIEAVVSSIGDPQRVIAGTDCGFDTAAGLRDVAEEVVWAKLAALSKGAEIASNRLL